MDNPISNTIKHVAREIGGPAATVNVRYFGDIKYYQASIRKGQAKVVLHTFPGSFTIVADIFIPDVEGEISIQDSTESADYLVRAVLGIIDSMEVEA